MTIGEFQTFFRPAEGALGGYIETFWAANGILEATRELIAPTGSTVAAVILGPPILQGKPGGEPVTMKRGFLIGPHERPVINQPTGRTFAVGLVTTPFGCEAVLGLPPAGLRGRVFELDSVWQHAPALRAALQAADDDGAPLAALVDLLESHLAAELNTAVPGLDRCAAAVALLQEDPMTPIPAVAARVGIAHGSLDREFSRIVGLTPKSLARIMRLRTLLADIDVYGTVHWARKAAQLGWFDQPHLIRDFARHTGVTPREYVAAQRLGYPPEQAAPGFVPQRAL